MFRLLTIEFHKLRYNKASKILSIIYFGLLTATALISAIKYSFGDFTFHFAEMGFYNFPYIWHFNTYIAAILKFFLLLVIVSMMSNEYSYKTLKQNLIDGLSKKEFILSKFYTVIAFAAISTIFVFFVTLILGLFYSDFNELSIIFSGLEYILAFFFKLIGFFSFGLFLGILVKRSAFAVGAMFVWLIVENLFRGFLFWQYNNSENTSDIVSSFMQFLPLEAMSNLIKEPVTRHNAISSTINNMGEIMNKSYDVEFTTILIVSFWTFIFIYSSYKLLLKRDL